MSWATWIGASAGLAALLVGSWWSLAPRWRKTRREIELICTPGHVPAPPTEAESRTLRRVAARLVWFQIGAVEVTGLENLGGGGPQVLAPTHGHYLDPFVLALVTPVRARCMTARGLLRFFGGLPALFLSRSGAFCSDLAAGKGAPALRAAVRILASGETLVMFPEGWVHMDGTLGRFRNGAVSVARMAAVKLNRPVPVVPVFLRYGAYPGSWINRLPPPLQYLTVLLGFARFRRGVRVVVGEPLLSSELPLDSASATRKLREAIGSLDPARSGAGR